MAKLFLNETLLRKALKHINEEIQVDPETGEWYDDGEEDSMTPNDGWEDAIYKHEMSKRNQPVEDDEPVYDNDNFGIDPEKTYWVSAGSSFPIDLKLKGEDISYCSQGMGSDNYQNAIELISSNPEVAEQLNGISDEQLDKWWFEDSFFDMSDEEKASATRDIKLAYLLADACGNAAEGDAEEVEDESPAGLPTNEELSMLKEVIKGIIRESIDNMGGIQSLIPMQGGDMAEKKHTWKSKHSQHNKHYKTKPKTERQARQTKRAIVIQWLKDPKNAVNGAEIMRQLWHPSPEEEDTKRGEFYKKRDGAINQDSGARYSFSDEEINALYRIKSHTG